MVNICIRCILVCLFLHTGITLAQDSATFYQGTDFRLAFLQNFRDNKGSVAGIPSKADGFKPRLFITAQNNASVDVQAPAIDFYKTVYVRAGTVVEVNLPSEVQLQGSGEISNNSVRLTSDEPITVYGLSHRLQSTDTWLAYPVSNSSTEYYVLAYERNFDDLTSEVAIIGVNDDTRLRFVASDHVENGPGRGEMSTYTINAGEVLLLQGADTPNNDLSGSRIVASQPVVVLAGHRCAQIPQDKFACNHLVEQVPPVQALGSKFYVSPLRDRSTSTVRVLATRNNTKVFQDYSLVAELNAGEVYETHEHRVPMQITTSAPVLVAQYSQGFSNGDSYGDPMMLFVTPVEQFADETVFVTPFDGAWRHYVNITVPEEGLGSVAINDELLSDTLFKRFGTSPFYSAEMQLDFGTYRISADEPIGTYLYGFGYAEFDRDAYGSAGGQSFRPAAKIADTIAPRAELVARENTAHIRFVDDGAHDSGLEFLEIIAGSLPIVRVGDIEPGVPQAQRTVAQISPEDVTTKKFVTFSIVDKAGNEGIYTICAVANVQQQIVYEVTEGYEPGCIVTDPRFLAVHIGVADVLSDAAFVLEPTDGIATGSHMYSRTSSMSLNIGIESELFEWDNDISFRAGIGLGINGATLMSPDTTLTRTRSVSGNIRSFQEQTRWEHTRLDLIVSGIVRYQGENNWFADGVVHVGLPVSSTAEVYRDILTPRGYAYANGTLTESHGETDVDVHALYAYASMRIGYTFSIDFNNLLSFGVELSTPYSLRSDYSVQLQPGLFAQLETNLTP